MLKVTKFGGSSLACAERFLRVRDIVLSDPARRVVVVSAAGRRHPDDHKITDLLYLCHAHLRCGVSCWDLWRRIEDRYTAIRDGCALSFPIERELAAIYASLSPAMSCDELASRGEYLSARLMADLLGFTFVDAKDWLRFDDAGNVLQAESYALLRQLAGDRRIVTPGFYGAMPGGQIRTFSRGGSDITGSLAAAALGADVYENWTDVPGVLAADPAVVKDPAPIPQLSYDELQTLSRVGVQVLHESAVAPVREAGIPLHIRSTLTPEQPGTRISAAKDPCPLSAGVTAFAGRRQLSLLAIRAESIRPAAVFDLLHRKAVPVFQSDCTPDRLTLLLSAPPADCRAAAAALRETLRHDHLSLRENVCLLAAVPAGNDTAASILSALSRADVTVHHALLSGEDLLLTIPDGQYETALRAACARP